MGPRTGPPEAMVSSGSSDFLSIPAEAAENFSVAGADGVMLRGYRLHRPESGPALLVGHATGLAAGSYLPWLDMLGVRARVLAYDTRGHGGSAPPAEAKVRGNGSGRERVG